MKLTSMLKDILFGLIHKPATLPYPNLQAVNPERLRGKLHWTPEGCTGCQLCVKDCPANALELFTIDKDSKQFVLHYDMSRCIYCSQCVLNCRFNCLTLSSDEWSLAAIDDTSFTKYYGDESNVQKLLAGSLTGTFDKST